MARFTVNGEVIRLEAKCYTNMSKMPFDKFIEEANKDHNKRFCYPRPELTDMESGILYAIAYGWTKEILDPAIKEYAKNIT